MTAVLEAVSISFRLEEEDRTILDGVDLSVEPGQVVAIEGRSGSGKSTFLSILGLLLTPTGGDVRVLGESPFVLAEAEQARFRGRNLGFVFQKPSLLAGRTAWQNVALPLSAEGAPPSRTHRDRAVEMLDRVELADRADAMPADLSGGEQQRVAIARALIRRPSVILADEPTGALDPKTAATVLDVLSNQVHHDGVSLVLVTHDRVVAGMADRRYSLVDGRLR